MTPRGGTPYFPINIRFLHILSILLHTSQVFSLSSFLFLSLGSCCNIDSDMSSGGMLSHKQRGKEIAASSSPSRDATEAPLEEFERIHHDAMMDTGNLDLSQRILISESARSYRQEVRGNPDEPHAWRETVPAVRETELSLSITCRRAIILEGSSRSSRR